METTNTESLSQTKVVSKSPEKSTKRCIKLTHKKAGEKIPGIKHKYQTVIDNLDCAFAVHKIVLNEKRMSWIKSKIGLNSRKRNIWNGFFRLYL